MNTSQCAALIQAGAAVVPNADISGLGVLIAFIFSAGATLAATLLAYSTGYVDDGLLRPVDTLVLRVPAHAKTRLAVHITLRKAVLALSDQQIVTGIAILAAGFNGLRQGSISVYHFQIVVYLAWMSSSVHLSALTLLRPFLHRHRGMMWWRVAGMLVLLVMLLVALVPTVSNDWSVVSIYFDQTTGEPIHGRGKSVFGVPARCFWGHIYGDGVNPDAILSFVVLFISYCWKMLGVFGPFRIRMERWFRNPLDGLLERMLRSAARGYRRHGGIARLALFRATLAVYLPLTAFLETLGSFSAALWLSVLGFIYGVMQILIPRRLVRGIDDQVWQAEDNFAFGQLLPLILLVQPLGAILEHVGLTEGTTGETRYGTADPCTAALSRFEAGVRQRDNALSLPGEPLLDHMAQYTSPAWTAQAPQRTQLQALLYKSKLFHLLVWMTQAAVVATASIVFYADYLTIGYVSTGSWYYIALSSAGWTGATPLVTAVLAGSSVLGRNTRRAVDTERVEPGLPEDNGQETEDKETGPEQASARSRGYLNM